MNLGREIFEWWQENASHGINSVLFAYSLGKAQRILGELRALTKKKVYTAPSVTLLTDCYRAEGVLLAETAL